jgi:hypothetical protein
MNPSRDLCNRADQHTTTSHPATRLLASQSMTTRLLNVFHCTADNIGDLMSGPSQYLWPAMAQVAPITKKLPANIDTAILGGGQIFAQLDKLSAENSERINPVKLIAWGVGLPVHGVRDTTVHKVAQRFHAFSTRNYDWKNVLPFVPCASCLSRTFDTSKAPQHEVVIYNHKKKPGAADVPNGVPVMTNSVDDPRLAIEFIASGETIVTSSYHGVYWAQLLGRRVVCIPYNNKFLTFQNLPSFAAPYDWRQSVTSAKRFPPTLEEYRSINRSFAQRAEQIWNE